MVASTLSPANRIEPRRCLPLRSALAVSTASTVCSAVHPCPGFPVQHSWGSAHPPGIPASRGPLRSRRDLPLLNLMPGPAFAVTSVCTGHRSFRGLLIEATVIARIQFPSCEDSSPSWASLCGTSLHPLVSLPEGRLTCRRCASKLANRSSHHRGADSLPSVASLSHPKVSHHPRPKAMTAAEPGAGHSADRSVGPVTCSEL
jgi:hypothetical protein